MSQIRLSELFVVAERFDRTLHDDTPQFHNQPARCDFERHVGILLDQQNREAVAAEVDNEFEQLLNK
jgi:hypothetical protein